MSSAVVSTSAALGRPFVFDDEAELKSGSPSPLVRVQSAISNQQSKISPARVTPASQLEIRPAPEMVSSGVPAIDALTGGLPRGCLTEICGSASSGRTTVLLAALAAATRRGEFCVIVDASDALDPQSAVDAGVDLQRLLWVRCGDDIQQNSHPKPPSPAKKIKSTGAPPLSRTSRQEPALSLSKGGDFDFTPLDFRPSEADHRLEQVLRATDLLLESGGFGLIVLDLGDLPPQSARRIPLTTWFRYRRAIEHTPTMLLAIEQQAIAGSCSSLLLQLGATNEPAAERRKIAAHGASRGFLDEDGSAPEGRKKINFSHQPELDLPNPPHAQLLTGLNITAELIRSRLNRKPARSVAFATKTAWAG